MQILLATGISLQTERHAYGATVLLMVSKLRSLIFTVGMMKFNDHEIESEGEKRKRNKEQTSSVTRMSFRHDD